MSLITRCPACRTLFKLVPDQLRISEGWVRCGQCAEAFDASLHMVPTLLAQTLPLSLPKDPPVVSSEPHDETLLAQAEEEAAAKEDSDPENKQVDKPELENNSQMQEAGQAAAVVALSVPIEASPAVHEAAADAQQDNSLDPDRISFLRQAKAPAAPTGKFMRVTEVFLSGVLLLGLFGQIILQQRDRIAAVQTDLKPWLKALCEPLNCSVSPWKNIDSIVIESSAFTRLRGDSYRLSFTLKSTAVVPVAVPALELTLTDALDQPVVRRVLMWSELAVTSDTLYLGLEQPVSVTLTVTPSGGTDRIAGYRLLAFYP